MAAKAISLGFLRSPHPVHEGRFAADEDERERQVSHAVLFDVADFLLGVVENRPFRSLTRSLTEIGELAPIDHASIHLYHSVKLEQRLRGEQEKCREGEKRFINP